MGVLARRVRRSLAVAVALAALAVAAYVGASHSEASSGVDIEGHGYGHGRGMGQWGAFGYARAGWNSNQILQHYYADVAFESRPNDVVRVRMDEVGNETAVIIDPNGGGLNVAAEGRVIVNTSYDCVRVRAVSIGENRYRVDCAPLFKGYERTVAANVSGPVYFSANRWSEDDQNTIRLYVPAGERWVRGGVIAQWADGAPRTINQQLMESFLRATVAAEMPYTWSPAALEAQTVAARSYLLAVRNWNRSRNVSWDTCTSTCQAYGGRRLNTRQLEWPSVDAAVAATSGRVMTRNGQPILAEYSASTGGYSAPGLDSQPWFRPVVDEGDATAGNPNHNWSVRVDASRIEARWPEIGAFTSMQVLERNGYGDWGGRVTKIVVRGSRGEVTVNGNTMRNAFNLKSDWFRIVGAPDVAAPRLTDPPRGLQPTDGLRGYLVASADGLVFSYGKARFFGHLGRVRLNQPIVGIATSTGEDGYWMVARDGGVFAFGAAPFRGSTGGVRLVEPIVGMARRPKTDGYWLVARDGGVFSFGAPFHGSTGGVKLAAPIAALAPTPTGNGYWMVAEDGGVFTFGDARFFGSLAGRASSTVVSIVPTPNGDGYWVVARDGTISSFGAAKQLGAPALPGLSFAGGAATTTGQGVVLATTDGFAKAYGDGPRLGGPRDSFPSWRGQVVAVAAIRRS